MKFFLLSLLFTFLFVLSKAQCLTEWKYYMPIIVENNSSTSLTDYQVKLNINSASLIASGKMKSNGDDIRFVDSVLCVPIQYWIENGMNTSSTEIWIKLPTLPSNAHRTIKMYYGNSLASSMSNGDSTFLLFDDFPGSSLSSKWDTVGSGCTTSISNGEITINAPRLYYKPITYSEVAISSASFTPPVIVEGKIDKLAGFSPTIAILNSGVFTGYSLYYYDINYDAGFGYVPTMDMGQTSASGGSISSKYLSYANNPQNLVGIWQIKWLKSGIAYSTWPGGSLTGTGVTQSSSVNIAFGMTYGSAGYVSFDWIRARKYATSDATFKVMAEVKNSSLVTSALSGGFFCTNSIWGASFSVYGSITFLSDNTFTVELSDSNGNFANPTTIGTYKSLSSSGTITCNTRNVMAGHHYKVRIISSDPAYIGTVSPTNITINTAPKAVVHNMGKTTFCEGNSCLLYSDSSSSFTYVWQKDSKIISGSSKPSYIANTSGKYSIIINNTEGCSDTAAPISVLANSLPAKPIIVRNGGILSTGKYYGYQWFLNDSTIAGATTATYSTSGKSGMYTISVLDSNGCANISEPYIYTMTGINNEYLNKQIEIFPNPARSMLNIGLSREFGFINLNVLDMNGKSIKINSFSINEDFLQVSLTNMSPGFYFIRIVGEKDTLIRKVEIQ